MLTIHSNIKSTYLKAIIQVFVFSFLFNNHAVGQYNLVPNPSIENCSNCLDNFLEFIEPNGPNIPGWSNPNILTPDLIKNINHLMPFDTIAGQNMFGIMSYQSIFNDPQPEFHDQRDYVQCELIDSLIYKKIYKVDFYSLHFNEFASFLTNNVGIHFSDTALHSNTGDYFNLDAQVKYFNNELVQNEMQWVKTSGIYEAIGGEKYMTVGNFNSDSETDFICQLPFWPAQGRGYVLLDKFSVTPLDSIPGGLQVNAGNDQSICIGDTVFIGEKISNLPAYWYLLDGTVVDTSTAGVYVHPTVTTTYVVTMTINGVYSTDTVTVTVGCAGIDEQMNRSFAIGPNPNDGTFVVSGAFSEGEQIILTTLDGKRVYSQVLPSNSEQEHVCTKLSPGTYFLEVRTAQGSRCFCDKIVIF
jgi:hypothetical protein